MRKVERKFLLLNEIEQVIEKMNNDLECIVVEGLKDRIALRELGFEKDIIECSNLGFGIIDELENKKVAILTDYDKHGTMMWKKLSRALESRGAKVDDTYRKKIGELLNVEKRKTIEAINNLKKEVDTLW